MYVWPSRRVFFFFFFVLKKERVFQGVLTRKTFQSILNYFLFKQTWKKAKQTTAIVLVSLREAEEREKRWLASNDLDSISDGAQNQFEKSLNDVQCSSNTEWLKRRKAPIEMIFFISFVERKRSSQLFFFDKFIEIRWTRSRTMIQRSTLKTIDPYQNTIGTKLTRSTEPEVMSSFY